MSKEIYVYVEHQDGAPDDSALELVAAARKIAPDASLTALVIGAGDEVDAICQSVAEAADLTVFKIKDDALAYPNAEIIRKALVKLLPSDAMVLIPHDTFGMDLGPGLAIKLDSAFVADVLDFEGVEGDNLKIVRQEFSGQVYTHVDCDISTGAVLNIRPGAFKADESQTGAGKVVDKSGDIGDLTSPRRFIEVVEAEAGEVDITAADVLVSVGRGIEDEDNMEMIFDLAKAMGAEVSCSRPIVDAKWLEKARQVGTSGQTVKPKVYLALGISGSFQHLGGLKGAPFVVAVNKNAKAPIFQAADVGVVADILDFVPELTEKVNEMK